MTLYPDPDPTLLDVLVAGFEKNEIIGGYHDRSLPMPDEDAAGVIFLAFHEEARRWKGTPLETHNRDGRRFAKWRDLEIFQAGRGILVRVRCCKVLHDTWPKAATWEGDPMGAIYDWLKES